MKNLLLGILVFLVFLTGCLQQQDANNDSDEITPSTPPNNDNQEEQEELIGCSYDNPSCNSSYNCVNNECVLRQGCNYNNSACGENYECVNNDCTLKQGCLYNNPSCSEGYACIENVCFSAECKKEEDCGPAFECIKEGENYYCEERGNCTYDKDCNYNEVCLSNLCNKVTICTSGECEDDYFELNDILIEEFGEQLSIRAKIIAKSEVKGTFRLLWNEAGSKGVMKSVSMEYGEEEDDLHFWIYLTPPEFTIEHYLIEHVEEPNLLYMIEKYNIEEE